MFNHNAAGRRREQRYAGVDYTQHNPGVGDGKDAFVDYFERMAARVSGQAGRGQAARSPKGDLRRRCTATSSWPGDHDYAGIDIFRFDDDGKIVEHWDVLQVIPDPADGRPTTGCSRLCSRPMSGVELVLAFLAGVVMGGALDRFVLPLLVDAWIDRLRRPGR